jgi:amino acid transporter
MLKRIHLELAGTHEYPEGNPGCGYEFVAPLDRNGHLDADAWSATKDRCTAAIAFLAVANGVLIQIVTLARLFYGMADEGYLPTALAQLNPRTQTPINATIAVGAIVLAAALLVSFEQLLVAANGVTLLLFALVNSALWRIKRRDPAPADAFVVPAWVPPLAAVTSMALLLTEFARRAIA